MKEVLRLVVYGGILLVPFIPLVVTDSLFFPFITGKNFGFRIIVEIIFAAWVVLALLDTAYRPRFSWILAFFASFIGILFFAYLFSENPLKSFWSNYERMEGFVALAHLFLYFVVLGSVMQGEKIWNYFFNATLFAASIISVIAFRQLAGDVVINQGGLRIDATLGNAAYMAVYMLFHVFIAFFMVVRSKTWWTRLLYIGLAVVFMYLLVQTATRGTILGLVGGLLTSALFITLFSRGQRTIRAVAICALVVIVLAAGSFYVFKDSEVVTENPVLSRVASISLEAGSTRFTIWGMALEGVKERPLLGWGQESFNYVFNQKYDPSLYGQEAWFDRVHNIFLDWLIAAGVLGFIAYFGILFATLYCLAIRPLLHSDSDSFSVPERGVLLGLLAGYFFHNIFVFDNIISYVFYATIIAYVHTKVAMPIQKVQTFSVSQKMVTRIVAPVVGVVLVFSVYVINVPHIRAAGDIIAAFQYIQISRDSRVLPTQRNDALNRSIAAFEDALLRDSFAVQEVREQILRSTRSIITDQSVPADIRERFLSMAVREIEAQIEETPNDARIRLFVASFYRAINEGEQALFHARRARELSPQKQILFFEEAMAHLLLGDTEKAKQLFKEAYELDTTYVDGAVFYAVGATYAGDMALLDEIVADEVVRSRYNQSDIVLQSLYQTGQRDRIIDILEARLTQDPDDLQLQVSLAITEYERGNSNRAIELLEASIAQFPAFRGQGEGFIADIRADRPIGTGNNATIQQ